ncbi:hypothetical protein BZG36_04871 [Bifiguratus adelaidae]|uniref:BAG domain-containing protein n=1 Tax=Bifiguratus adelaidae TaxID=1938954 RepID=A0A261XUJ1_9FUNG|nr:hypothetical protein BZG36_04871 [Bifiguratus adelaidae]
MSLLMDKTSIAISIAAITFAALALPLLAEFLNVRKITDEERQCQLFLNVHGQRYVIKLRTDGGLEAVTLKRFKDDVKQLTGVPVNGMKLSYGGAILKDETATLKTLGLYGGATVDVHMIDDRQDSSEYADLNPEERALIVRIQTTVSKVDEDLAPIVEKQERNCQQYPDISSSAIPTPVRTPTDSPTTSTTHLPLSDPRKLYDTHNYLSEKLLQALFALDGIEAPTEFSTARQKRREAVRHIQGYLDRIDKAKKTLPSL